MSTFTFDRMYLVTFGQYDELGGFVPLTEIDEHRIKANIVARGEQDNISNALVSTLSVFNLNPDVIATLTGTKNLYVQIQAGYFYDNGLQYKKNLPIIYFGSVVQVTTTPSVADLITTFQCTAFNERVSRAKANRVFAAGARIRDIFDYLGKTMSIPINHLWNNSEITFAKTSRTVEGPAAKVLEDWCARYDLRAITDKGSIKLVDKAVSLKDLVGHHIPLSRIKGYPNLSMDLSKSIKENTTTTPTINLDTFLFPEVSLNQTVLVELINYEIPRPVGDYTSTIQSFVVKAYTHILDSHEGTAWTTKLVAKGQQV